MEYQFGRFSVVIAVYMLLIAVSSVRQSDGRELRPSPHGFSYQDLPPAAVANSPEALSFFGGTGSTVPFPEARNMSGPSWRSSDGAGRSRDGGRNRVWTAVLVACVACGISGVVLLAVAVFIFVKRTKGHHQSTTSSTNTRDK